MHSYRTIAFKTKKEALEREKIIKDFYKDSLLKCSHKKDVNNLFYVSFVLNQPIDNF